jgi:hypothetical protein
MHADEVAAEGGSRLPWEGRERKEPLPPDCEQYRSASGPIILTLVAKKA